MYNIIVHLIIIICVFVRVCTSPYSAVQLVYPSFWEDTLCDDPLTHSTRDRHCRLSSPFIYYTPSPLLTPSHTPIHSHPHTVPSTDTLQQQHTTFTITCRHNSHTYSIPSNLVTEEMTSRQFAISWFFCDIFNRVTDTCV